MNLQQALEYCLENRKAVLKTKGAKEATTILRMRGSHVGIQELHPYEDRYTGNVPIYMNFGNIRSEWEETGKTWEEIRDDIPNLRKRQEERRIETIKNCKGTPPL